MSHAGVGMLSMCAVRRSVKALSRSAAGLSLGLVKQLFVSYVSSQPGIVHEAAIGGMIMQVVDDRR